MASGNQHPFIGSLFRAVETNDIFEVRSLLERGCDVNGRDKGGSTPIMRASFHGFNELLDLLIRSGANAEIQDRFGRTALHYAAQEYHEGAVKALLEKGADPNSKDVNGNTPLSNAVFYSKGKGAVIKLLLKGGADPNLPNSHGVSPLALAKSIATFDAIKYF